jgi:hypothetical protein
MRGVRLLGRYNPLLIEGAAVADGAAVYSQRCQP